MFKSLISLLIEVCCYENSAFILCFWLPRHCLNNDDMKTPKYFVVVFFLRRRKGCCRYMVAGGGTTDDGDKSK